MIGLIRCCSKSRPMSLRASPTRMSGKKSRLPMMTPSGTVTYLLGGRKVTVEAGRLAVFWAAIPHQIIDARGVKSPYFVATLPLAWFLQAKLPDRLVQPILHAEMVCDPKSAPRRDRHS